MPPRTEHAALAALVGAALLAATLPAHAARPLTTEDAGTLEPKACEAQLVLSNTREAGTATQRSSGLDLGCGIGWNTQLNLNLGHSRAGDESGRSLSLYGKTAIVPGSETSPGWTVAYGLAAERSAGSSLALESQWVTGVLSWPLNKALVGHANLGWQRSRSAGQDSSFWALALEHLGDSGLDVTGEVYATDRERSPWLQVGLRWTLQPERWSLNASWARQTGGTQPRTISLGGLLKF